MRNRFTWLGALAGLALAVAPAHAQLFGHKRSSGDCCVPCYPAPCPTAVTPAPTPTPTPTPTPMTQPPTEPFFSPEQAAAGGGEGFALDSGVGYIDSALVRSMFRLRADAAYTANRPDRAEFFYPKCGCFRINGADPDAKGPPPGAFNSGAIFGNVGADANVDYQEINAYLEYAFTENISGFVEVPFRIVNFSIFSQEEGFGDINFGVKAALLASDDQVVTAQFRTYTSTGLGDRGLGTQHVSLEPGLLVYQRLSDKVIAEGEFRWWIPIGGSDFAGDVIRYGIGFSYLLVDTCKCHVMPVAEVVGWTVLDGMEFDPDIPGAGLGAGAGAPEDASGDTIVNLKLGVRVGNDQQDVYLGYGRALTGEFWYKDIIRFEYRRAF